MITINLRQALKPDGIIPITGKNADLVTPKMLMDLIKITHERAAQKPLALD